MTMPITRKTYAMSKYITCCVVILVGNIVTISLYVSVGYIVGENIDIKEVLIIMLAIFVASMIAGSVGIPSNLKFGVQKGSVMMIVFIAGISALGMMIFKILEFFEVNVQEIFLTLTSWDEGALIATAAAAVIIITTISYLISERIMIKKEF